jgi:tetratricopeptide (TPR) repeat protein
MTKFYLLVITASVYLLGCKSASKSYQKGDYADAIELGVKKLQKDPYDGETKEIVQSAYTYAVNERENQIRILSNSKDENRFEKIYQQYLNLQDLYQTIHAYPVAARLIKAQDYSEYVETYRDKAAEAHIIRANVWLQENTKKGYREAYNELKTALRYRPNDIELGRKTDSAYNKALVKVVIAPMQNYGYRYASAYQLDKFQNDVVRNLSYSMGNEFVKFFSEGEARTKDITPDQTLELNLGRISIGQPYDNQNSREVSKEVVVKETVYKPDSVVKQYATVKARITTTERTLLSEGDMTITVKDPKGKVLWNDRFSGDHRWKTEFASYTGDERALSDSDKNLLNRNTTTNSPREEDILEALFQQIRNGLSNKLRTYYSQY